ncbi:hypothetical protein [Flaviaesturariibacter aridisoli]|uniref:hypothetical protein n=1 Tax=Flaviaesturariibacter aridisoli TaxID=2545761 RepID=UPI001404D8C5|nr:hypothetical protein [Flaviaesturariibacter aridisoli]
MATNFSYQSTAPAVRRLVLDLEDCYTWSFPEFCPFCTDLYYISSFKIFKPAA